MNPLGLVNLGWRRLRAGVRAGSLRQCATDQPSKHYRSCQTRADNDRGHNCKQHIPILAQGDC